MNDHQHFWVDHGPSDRFLVLDRMEEVLSRMTLQKEMPPSHPDTCCVPVVHLVPNRILKRVHQAVYR